MSEFVEESLFSRSIECTVENLRLMTEAFQLNDEIKVQKRSGMTPNLLRKLCVLRARQLLSDIKHASSAGDFKEPILSGGEPVWFEDAEELMEMVEQGLVVPEDDLGVEYEDIVATVQRTAFYEKLEIQRLQSNGEEIADVANRLGWLEAEFLDEDLRVV